jgi:trimeric autotransporter adhesin
MRRRVEFFFFVMLLAGAQGIAQRVPGVWGTPEKVTQPVAEIQPLTGITEELPLSEGAGTVAHDVSGNGNDATFCTAGSQPAWSAQGLVFAEANGATNSCLDTPLTNWQSVFIYVCPYPGAFPNSIQDPGANGMTDNSIFGSTTLTDGLAFTGSPYGNLLLGMEPTIYYMPRGTNDGPTYTSQISGGCHVFAATLGSAAAGTLDHIYVDGVEQPYAAQAADADLATTAGHYQIGCVASCTASYDQFHFQGMVGYFVASEEQYSGPQVQLESSYILRQVDGRGDGSFSAGAFGGNTIVAVGDSLTAGADGTRPGWYALLQTNTTYTTTSLGISGMWARDMAAMWSDRESSYFSPQAGRQYCHIWAGTNDMRGGQEPVLVWQALISLGQECAAAGGIPIVATMISRYQLDAEKNQLNALIRAGWQQAGFAALDDLAAIPEIGADGAYANLTYFVGDGTHLTGPNGVCDMSSGYSIVCNAVSSVVNQLDAAVVRKRGRLEAEWRR